jgi:hypothetical protein
MKIVYKILASIHLNFSLFSGEKHTVNGADLEDDKRH